MLGGCKPSEITPPCWRFAVGVKIRRRLFTCLFLQRLPREIIVLLARVDHKDPKALAQQADELGLSTMAAQRLWRLCSQIMGRRWFGGGPPSSDRGRGGTTPESRSRGAGGHSRGDRGGGQPASEKPEASKEARLVAGLCIKHWCYGEAASSCSQPCSWQGNGAAGGNWMLSSLANSFILLTSCWRDSSWWIQEPPIISSPTTLLIQGLALYSRGRAGKVLLVGERSRLLLSFRATVSSGRFYWPKWTLQSWELIFKNIWTWWWCGQLAPGYCHAAMLPGDCDAS